MQGDGDGWVFGQDGSKHWGRYGAAGLLLRAPAADGASLVLLQHRAQWSHQGGTWALPGGARDSHESAADAAVREAEEEAGIAPDAVIVRAERVTSAVASGWSYTTVVAEAPHPLPTAGNHESTELRWVPESEVEALLLHPGFASSWPHLRTAPVHMVVDPDSVNGSAGLVRRLLELTSGAFGWVHRVITPETRSAVADAAHDAGERVAHAVVVVTADADLAERLPAGVHVLAPDAV